MGFIEFKTNEKKSEQVKLIDRKCVEKIIKTVNLNKVAKLAYKNWSPDQKKGVVSVNLSTGELIGYSVSHNISTQHTNDIYLDIFELDASVELNDEIVILGNSRVEELRNIFGISEKIFSKSIRGWVQAYCEHISTSLEELRLNFIKLLYCDYYKAFYSTSIKNQLNAIYA